MGVQGTLIYMYVPFCVLVLKIDNFHHLKVYLYNNFKTRILSGNGGKPLKTKVGCFLQGVALDFYKTSL